MIGEDYPSLDAFVQASLEPDQELSPGHTLAKIYSIEQLQELAEREDIDSTQILREIERSGTSRRYEFAYAITDHLGANNIGELLSDFDHDLFLIELLFKRNMGI